MDTALSNDELIEQAANWCRRYIEKHRELPPLLLMDCPDGLYAADMRRIWGDQPARQRAVEMAGALLGFGLRATRMIALMDTWIREFPHEPNPGMSRADVDALVSTLPDAADDPSAREALTIAVYTKGNDTADHYSQMYERTVTLDATTFEWSEPKIWTSPCADDYTFAAFFESVARVEAEGTTGYKPERDNLSMEEHMDVGRAVALKLADRMLKYTRLADDTLTQALP